MRQRRSRPRGGLVGLHQVPEGGRHHLPDRAGARTTGSTTGSTSAPPASPSPAQRRERPDRGLPRVHQSDNEKMKKVSRKIAFNVLDSFNGAEYVNVCKVGPMVADKLENRFKRFDTHHRPRLHDHQVQGLRGPLGLRRGGRHAHPGGPAQVRVQGHRGAAPAVLGRGLGQPGPGPGQPAGQSGCR